jgi:hypothetical protein
MRILLAAAFATSLAFPAFAVEEMIIGDERIEPGVRVIFEGAVKDTVHHGGHHLAEKDTDVHLEARINWDEKDLPPGAPAGGFVPNLAVSAEITNEKTGKVEKVELVTHLNLVDNFHYARNMKLPGAHEDRYTVTFHVSPPSENALTYHHDWENKYKSPLFAAKSFTYKNQDFSAIAKATRR